MPLKTRARGPSGEDRIYTSTPCRDWGGTREGADVGAGMNEPETDLSPRSGVARPLPAREPPLAKTEVVMEGWLNARLWSEALEALRRKLL